MKVYLIDDDPICNYLAQFLLKREGFSTDIMMFTAASEALNSMKLNFPSDVPSVIFLDINMPEMNGWDFLDALTAYKEQLYNKCHIFILSSSVDPSDIIKSKDYKLVGGFLHKPITSEDVQLIKSEVLLKMA